MQLSKKTIIELSRYFKLKFINDYSNNDLSFDRNYIRNKIVPSINKRWENINKVMNHNIKLQNNYSLIVTDYCENIYMSIIRENQLEIEKLLSYPDYLYSTFLRYWISKEVSYNLSKNEIYSLLSIIKGKNNDYPTYILKNGISIIRYNDCLYIVKNELDKVIE